MAGLPKGAMKMYSLDQVIYFLEQRQQTEDWNIMDAAIAYLKGYREILPEYSQMKLDAVKNDPLSWQDLKQMEGKPVWYEVLDVKDLPALDQAGWGLVGHSTFTTWQGVESFSLIRIGVTYALPIAGYGKTWVAYRKERK